MDSVFQCWQARILLSARPRGFHLISAEIHHSMATMPVIKIGMANLFLQHTSASITISENTCADVRQDLESHFNQSIPEDPSLYLHSLEGDDDMPAHIKNVTIGSSLSIPISNSQLQLGRWQGIYLCEHRNQASARQLIITVMGEK